jgi:small subunit ribosomal protein S13
MVENMSTEFRHIIRVLGTDIDGNLEVPFALTKIKGVGLSLAEVILKKAKITLSKRAGFLSDNEVEKIEQVINEPIKHGLPFWLLNRRNDFETGKSNHLIEADLILRNKMDIDKMRQMKSWKGYRHAYGLKVRGQRTKTTGRAGKSLGVKRKTLRQGGN